MVLYYWSVSTNSQLWSRGVKIIRRKQIIIHKKQFVITIVQSSSCSRQLAGVAACWDKANMSFYGDRIICATQSDHVDNDNNPGSYQLQQRGLCRKPWTAAAEDACWLWAIIAEQLKNLKLHQFTDDWQETEKHDTPTKQQQEPNKFIEKLVNSNTFMQNHRDDPQSSRLKCRENRILGAPRMQQSQLGWPVSLPCPAYK